MNNKEDFSMYKLATELSEYAEKKGVSTTEMAGALAILTADTIHQTRNCEKPVTLFGFIEAVKSILSTQNE